MHDADQERHKKMAQDLDLPLEVRGCPTVREPDGLALSSRNQRLTAEERRQAAYIVKGLHLAEKLHREGENNVAALDKAVREYWQTNIPDGTVDYLEFVHSTNLSRLTTLDRSAIAAAAVKFGKARLIDNIVLER